MDPRKITKSISLTDSFSVEVVISVTSVEFYLKFKALIRVGLTAIEGMVAFGAGGLASLAHWEGGNVVNIGSYAINVPETIVQNFVSDIFGNPSGWLLDLIMDYYA